MEEMKLLGLIGGTSWHSTAVYYEKINQGINDHFGNNTNPPLLLYNMNQALVHQYQREDRWDSIADMIIAAASKLEKGDVEALVLCANTPHKVFDRLESAIDTPIIHIADATAAAINQRGLDKVAFIGTKFSMELDFITSRIARHGIEVLVPEEKASINELHRIIQEELTFGEIKPASKTYVSRVIIDMVEKGAQGVIMGCTEFPLMFDEGDLSIPVFNTTDIHAQKAVEFILGKG